MLLRSAQAGTIAGKCVFVGSLSVRVWLSSLDRPVAARRGEEDESNYGDPYDFPRTVRRTRT